MPPRPIINDALWRCLCPRYSQLAAGSKSAVRNGTAHSTATGKPNRQQWRTYSSQASPVADPFAESYPISPQQIPQPGPKTIPGSRKSKPLSQLPLPELYEQLRFDGAAGRHQNVMNIVEVLIRDRRERPNVHMYTAILHSYANCTEGTAGKLGKVLDDMEKAGVELDGRGCECVLEALAVHPDYLLRNDILEYMRVRWFTLSERAQNFVVAGMLRDRLFEQALETLEGMTKQRVQVHQWLWDKAMWILLEFGEVEEAFYVLSLRQNVEGPGVKLSNSLWQRLLDSAAKLHLAEATAAIWNTQVIPGYLKPPTGTCVDALSVAARSGDVKLATDVFHVLAERGTVLTAHHYEALMESYLSNDDLYAALNVVLYMHDSVLKVSPDALHPLFTYLSKNAGRPMEAFTILQGFNDVDKKTVPVTAVNTCIHASIDQGRLAEAIDFYKALHTVAKAGPNANTFNILLQGCHRRGRKELAMYLAGEMIERKIAPDRLTYDRLIIVCLNADEVKDALLYYEEMKGEGFEPRRGTHELLMRKSVEVGDARAVAMLRDYKKRWERGEVERGRLGMFERLVAGKFDVDDGNFGVDDGKANVDDGKLSDVDDWNYTGKQGRV